MIIPTIKPSISIAVIDQRSYLGGPTLYHPKFLAVKIVKGEIRCNKYRVNKYQ